MTLSAFWDDLIARKKLFKVFRSGEIYLTVGTGDNERKIYPKVHHIEIKKNASTFVFTIPNGLDPKILKKNYYVFEQYFGKRIMLDGEIKRFTLTVKTQSNIKAIPYDYDHIHELIEKEGFKIPIVTGFDKTMNLILYDATNNPNCLIFGQPGSGKSSMLHVINTTLIQYYPPEKLHFYMADFKMSEFPVYEGVKHVKSVSYLTKDFAPVLRHLKKELTKRGELLKEHRVRHVNKLPDKVKPPYIVLCVDEFVMIKDDNIMADLLQVASLGRAYGIYAILSMQRPSHKILSTDVRGLLSVRFGFRTVDKRNSLIGETPGSEKISKDEPGTFMLNLDELTELKAPFLDEDDTEKILAKYKIDDWKNHNYKAQIKEDIEQKEVSSQPTEKDVFEDAN